ncbi:redoxin domain-containing protein [Cellulomonas sp. ES6]|uniref:redoxin domain-containing protein n=1 Tax=Cellulomonas sp. ES6 TaxID=3039384 RepID=UPI0024B737F4|nr:redoxin domain-containing protein [Cellulomonas sp. ES6]WHP18220.1 redoxin domain-containing protein [Cellulomonas sp. ES6]
MTGGPLPEGAVAPVVTLPDTHGASVTVGGPAASATLLVFVPFAFSRTCTAELTELQDGLEELRGAGVRVLAASCDPVFALRAWAEQDGYRFDLLSDFWPHGAAARAYGVFDDAQGFARRGSFLLDADGVVRWTLVHPGGQARPFAAYREAVAGL